MCVYLCVHTRVCVCPCVVPLPFLPLFGTYKQRLCPSSTLTKAHSECYIQKTASSHKFFSLVSLFSVPPEIARGLTLFPSAAGSSGFPQSWCQPCYRADWLTEKAGEQVSMPFPASTPTSVQARPLWSSLSHHLVQQEPRRLLSPGLLHGQRTALPAKPPGRPITKLNTVQCALSL